MRNRIYKHLGYFYNISDIRELSQKSADEIIDYYNKGLGTFHITNYENEKDSYLYEQEEYESGAVDRGDTRFTKNGKYAIVDLSWGNWKEECANIDNSENSDCYIDIYICVEDNTLEICPHCGNKIEVEAELKISKCPKCNNYFPNCSMCKNKELNYPCSEDCCLKVLAITLNNKE